MYLPWGVRGDVPRRDQESQLRTWLGPSPLGLLRENWVHIPDPATLWLLLIQATLPGLETLEGMDVWEPPVLPGTGHQEEP